MLFKGFLMRWVFISMLFLEESTKIFSLAKTAERKNYFKMNLGIDKIYNF
jgi:hypothetical protein